jgi:hypothetical protein
MKLQISQPIHWIEEIGMQFSMAFQYAFNTKVDANETVDKSPAGLIKLLPSFSNHFYSPATLKENSLAF